MKINTDGVLLGALAQSNKPAAILDVGTGTGVIALMLAQRFPVAKVDALEIDQPAAQTARANFKNSKFDGRLQVFDISFQQFSLAHPDVKYDLIVSNPPFFTDSLKNPDKQKHVARHTNEAFFADLIRFCKKHLNVNGTCYFVVPPKAAKQLMEEGLKNGIYLQQAIDLCSFYLKPAHRKIIRLGFEIDRIKDESFIIYESEKIYSEQYRNVLKDFFTIF